MILILFMGLATITLGLFGLAMIGLALSLMLRILAGILKLLIWLLEPRHQQIEEEQPPFIININIVDNETSMRDVTPLGRRIR
jgi:hypothetical protein